MKKGKIKVVEDVKKPSDLGFIVSDDPKTFSQPGKNVVKKQITGSTTY